MVLGAGGLMQSLIFKLKSMALGSWHGVKRNQKAPSKGVCKISVCSGMSF